MRPKELKEELSRQGFGFSNEAKGGHVALTWEGELLRSESGRPVVIPVHGSKNALSSGVASQLRRQVAPYLEQIRKRA